MKFNWNYPTTVWVGQDRVGDLVEACINLNINKPLFVTDKDLINLPFIIQIISEIKDKFQELRIFSNFSGNPIGENVDEGVNEFKINNCDGVIAIGGGSAIDVGKAIAFMSGQKRPIWDFEDIGDYWKRADAKKFLQLLQFQQPLELDLKQVEHQLSLIKKLVLKKLFFIQKYYPLL